MVDFQSPYHEETFEFSKPLKLRLVAYFRKEYDLDIKDEEANLFLTSLAALYDALSKAPATLQPEPSDRLSGAGRAEVAGDDTPSRGVGL